MHNNQTSEVRFSNICLIGGSGRSGTTLLQRIFSKHPQVVDIPEWRCLIDPDGLIDFYNTFATGWSPYLYDSKVKRLEKILRKVGKRNYSNKLFNRVKRSLPRKNMIIKPTFQYSGTDILKACPQYLEYVDDLIEKLIEFRYQGTWAGMEFMERHSMIYASPPTQDGLTKVLGDFYRSIVQGSLNHQQAKYYVEKNTWNILWFDKIRHLLPESKLIHIYRDPRDVVASYTKQNWMPSNPIYAAKCYKGIIEKWWDIREDLPKNSYKEISLEELVLKPEFVLQEICEFWEIEWHQSLLEKDLSRSNSGRWEKEFTDEQKEQLNTILHNQIQQMGYQ